MLNELLNYFYVKRWNKKYIVIKLLAEIEIANLITQKVNLLLFDKVGI